MGNIFGKDLWCQLLIFWWVYWTHDGGKETWVSIMIRHDILVIIWSLRFTLVEMLDFYIHSATNDAYIYTILHTVSTHDPKEIKWAFHHLGMGGLRSNEMRYEAKLLSMSQYLMQLEINQRSITTIDYIQCSIWFLSPRGWKPSDWNLPFELLDFQSMERCLQQSTLCQLHRLDS